MIQAKMMAQRRLSKTLSNGKAQELHQRQSQRSEPSVAALQNIPWTARVQSITRHERVSNHPTMQLLIDKGKRNGLYVTAILKQQIGPSAILSPQEDLNLNIKSALVDGKHQIQQLLAYDDHKVSVEETSNGKTGCDYRDIPCVEASDRSYEPVVQNKAQVLNQPDNRQDEDLKIYYIKYVRQSKNNIKMNRKVEKPNNLAQSSKKIGALAKYGHKGSSRVEDESTSEKISFFVRLPSGQTIWMKADPSKCTVSDLRMRIWSRFKKRDLKSLDNTECTPVNIIYRGRTYGQKDKHTTIAEMGMQPYSTLETGFDMLGGSEQSRTNQSQIDMQLQQLSNNLDVSQLLRSTGNNLSEATTSQNDLLMQLFSHFEELKQNKGEMMVQSENYSDNKVQTLQATPVLKEFQKYIVGLNLDNAQVLKLAIKLGLSGRQRDILNAFCTHQLRQVEILLLLPTLSENQKRSLLEQLKKTLKSKVEEDEIRKLPPIVNKQSQPDKQNDIEEFKQSNSKEQAQDNSIYAEIEKDAKQLIGSYSPSPLKGLNKIDHNDYKFVLERIDKLLKHDGDIDLQDEEFHGEQIADLWFKFAHQTRNKELCEASVKICEQLTNAQWCSIFLEILQDQQLNAIFEALSEERIKEEGNTNYQEFKQAEDFWECLSQEENIRIYKNLTKEMKGEILSIPSKLISQEQTLDLWSDVICLREAKIWEGIGEEMNEKILEKMETSMKIAIWQQISKEEQLSLYRNLDKKDEFWNQASFQQQKTILEDLEENDQDIQQLLQLLDQDSLSISVCMHPNQLTKFLSKEQKKSIQEYKKYGVSSTTDMNKEKFVQDLMDKQYEDFNSLKLLKNKGQYRQVIKNPRLDDGLIIVQDFEPNFKYDDNKECLCLQSYKQKKAEVFTNTMTSNELHEFQNECLHQKKNVVRLLKGSTRQNQDTQKLVVTRSEPMHHKCTIISYWRFIDQVGLHCTHSFIAPHMFSRLICSHDGQNSEVFFIQKRGEKTVKDNPSQNSLYLHFLNLDRPEDTHGDRELKNNCKSYRMPIEGHFSQSLLEDDSIEKEKADENEENKQVDDSHDKTFYKQVPTLIKIPVKQEELKQEEQKQDEISSEHNSMDENDEEEKEDPAYTNENHGETNTEENGVDNLQNEDKKHHKFLVYKYTCSQKNASSDKEKGIFFFQVESNKTVARIADAELFIDSFTNEEGSFFIRYMTENKLWVKQIDIDLLISKTENDKIQELQFKERPKYYELDNTKFKMQTKGKNNNVATIQVISFKKYHRPFKNIKAADKKNQFQRETASFQILVEDSAIEQQKQERVRCFIMAKIDLKEEQKKRNPKRKRQKSSQQATKDEKVMQHEPEYKFVATSKTFEANQLVTFVDEEKVSEKKIFTQQDYGSSTWLYPVTKTNKAQYNTQGTQKNDINDQAAAFNFKFDKPIKLVSSILKLKDNYMGVVITKDDQLMYFSVNEQELSQVDKKFNIKLQKYMRRIEISYPIVAYAGIYPDNRDIIIGNLADSQYPQEITKLPFGRQLICFAGCHENDKIKLLTYQRKTPQKGKIPEKDESFYLCDITKPFPFKKRKIYGESSDITLEFIELMPPKTGNAKHKDENEQGSKSNKKSSQKGLVSDFDYRSIRVAEFFSEYKNKHATTSSPQNLEQQNTDDDLTPEADKNKIKNFVVICQTSDSIWRVANKESKESALKISKPTFSVEIEMKRCKDRSLYWIEYFKQSQVSSLRRLSKQAIIVNKEKEDITTQDLQLVDVKISDLIVHIYHKNEISYDQIFILDKEDIKLYSYQVDNNDKSRIEQLNEPKSLSGLLNVNQEWLDSHKVPRLYLERDKDQNYNLDTYCSISCVKKQGIVYHNFETQASSVISTDHEGFQRKMNLTKDGKYRICMQRKIRNTNRLMGLLQDEETREYYMMCYNSLQSREHDLLGYLGNTNIKQAKFISQDKVLVNLKPVQDYLDYKTQDQRNATSLAGHQASSPQSTLKDQRNNWTIVDSSGQVKQLPRQLTDDWELRCYSSIDEGTFLIFKNTDSFRYLQFNLRGEIQYEKYLEDLKIMKILQSQYDRQKKFYQSANNQLHTKLKPLLKNVTDSSDNGIASTINLSKQFLIDKQGRVFKLATIISSSNDQQINQSMDQNPCSLYGAFLLLQIQDEKLKKQKKDEEYLTVLIFNCESKVESQEFLNQMATICGDYLCYQTYTQPQTYVVSSNDHIEDSDSQLDASMQDKNDVLVLDKSPSHEIKANKFVKKDQQNSTKKNYLRMISLSEIKSKLESSIVERAEFMKKNKEQQLVQTQILDSERGPLNGCEFSINDPKFDQVFGYSQNQQKLDYKSWLWIKDTKIKDKMKIGSDVAEDGDTQIFLKSVYNSMQRFPLRKNDEKVNETETQNYKQKNECLLQVTFSNKILLYDLHYKTPKQVYGIFDTNFFKDKENFVELGIEQFLTKKYTTRAEAEKPTMHVWHLVTASPSKAYYMVKDSTYLEIDEEEDEISGEENEQKQKKKSEKILCLQKTYSTMDLQGLKWLILCLSKDSEEDKSLHRSLFQSTMASFKGHNVFSIFKEQENNGNIQKIIELIAKEINSLALLNDQTETQGKDYVYMRMLYRIFTMPTPQFKGQKFQKIDWGLRKKDEDSKSRKKQKLRKDELLKLSKKDNLILDQLENQTPYTTILRDCIFFKQSVRDKFLQLASKNWEFMLSDFAIEQTMTGHMIMKYSSILHQFFVDQINGIPMTTKIVDIKWPAAAAKINRLTFRKQKSFISKQNLQKKIVQHFKDIGVSTKKLQQTQVEVKVLNADWLLHGGVSLIDFSYKLLGTSSERIFETEFMQVLVQGFWYNQVIWIKGFCFIPWVIYMMSTLCLYSLVLNKKYEDNRTNLQNIFKDVSITVTLLLLVLQYYIKLMQMRARGSFSQKSISDFFSNMMNIIDLFQYGSTAWIALTNFAEKESGFKKEQRILAAFSVFTLFLKAFDWLRLFDSTSFYIKLLTQTFRDIEAFMILLFAGLSMIGCSMFMLSLNTQEDKASIITPVFDVFILDSILNQYMLALGEFEMDAFNDNPQWYLCYMFFLMATFVTQVTMFNMLIAIMGNTFSMVIENREIHATMQKLSIMSEYSQVFWFKSQEDLKNFLFVVKIVVDEGEQVQDAGDWEGGFSQIKKTLTKKIDMIDRKFADSLKGAAHRQKVLVGNLHSSLNLEMKQIRSQISVSRDETKSISDLVFKIKSESKQQNKLIEEMNELFDGDLSDGSVGTSRSKTLSRMKTMNSQQPEVQSYQLNGKRSSQVQDITLQGKFKVEDTDTINRSVSFMQP